VDHDKDAVEEVIHAIGSLALLDLGGDSVVDHFELIPIVIEVSSANSVVSSFIREYNMFPRRPNDLILVDLFFGTENEREADQRGRAIAQLIRKRLGTEVGVYSRFRNKNWAANVADLSADGLSPVVLEIRDLTSGPNTVGGEFWYNLFLRSGSRMRSDPAASHGATDLELNDSDLWVSWADNQRPSSMTIDAVARELAQRILLSTFQHTFDKVELSPLGGGFSGSWLFLGEVTGQNKQFVFKVDEDPSTIRKEVEGYRLVKEFVSSEFFPQLLEGSAGEWVQLSPGLWGAFGIEFMSGFQPVATLSELFTLSENGSLARVWKHALGQLYGNPQPVKNGPFYLSNPTIIEAEFELLRKSSQFVAKEGLIQSFPDEVIDPIDEFIAGANSRCVPMVSRSHGDLNLRNLLFRPGDSSFRLLDFPHVNKPSPACKDFAKVEVDAFLQLFDREGGRCWDFRRIPLWHELGRCVWRDAKFPLETSGSDTEYQRFTAILNAIRQEMYELLDGFHVDDVKNCHQTCVELELLKSLSYKDIPFPKRLASAQLAVDLAGGF
jgi:hypothetical protein